MAKDTESKKIRHDTIWDKVMFKKYLKVEIYIKSTKLVNKNKID